MRWGATAMIMNSGYIDKIDEPIVDNLKPLTVNSSGNYKLIKQNFFSTCRPNGRIDYQIIYVYSGCGYFRINGEYVKIDAGNLILFLPGDPQDYYYYLSDNPEVFWAHFSGYECDMLLNKIGFIDKRVVKIGDNPVYRILFKKIIREIQLKRVEFLEFTNLNFRELLLTIIRDITKNQSELDEAMENTILYFHSNFSSEISIHNYANSIGLTTNWFIRCFKKQFGISPNRYIINLRISKAKDLLTTSNYYVNEIAEIVGYQNPLYFSRIFKKETGISPNEYRKMHIKKELSQYE